MTSSPILRPSPLDLGATLAGAFGVFRRRLSQFVVLALLQGLVMGLVIGAAVAVFVVGLVEAIRRLAPGMFLFAGVLALFAAVIVAVLIQIRVQAMLVLGAHDEIQGRLSSIRDVFRRTSGVAARMALLVLAVVAGIFVLYGLFAALMWGAVVGMLNSRDLGTAIGALVALYLVFVFVMIAVAVTAIYFQVRFLYLLPALAVERRGAIDALKRSWGLTKGNVLRTLGYYLVASLLVSLLSSVVQMIPQITLAPAFQRTEDAATSTAVFMALMPFLVLIVLLQVAVQLLAMPFLSSYITVMFVDQNNRHHLPYHQPGFPVVPPAPGYPGQTYPTQTHSSQGYPSQHPPGQGQPWTSGPPPGPSGQWTPLHPPQQQPPPAGPGQPPPPGQWGGA